MQMKTSYKIILLILAFIIILLLVYFIISPSVKYDSSVEQYGKWSSYTQNSLEKHNCILPSDTDIPDMKEYVLIEYPESMKFPSYYISCCIHQPGEMEKWKNICAARAYNNVTSNLYNHIIYYSDTTLKNINELINDEVYDGKELFFSFVEIREKEQDIVFTIAEMEDGLDSDISSFNHYLFSFITIEK